MKLLICWLLEPGVSKSYLLSRCHYMWRMNGKQCIKYCPKCKAVFIYEPVAAEDVEVEEQDRDLFSKC
ncbi:hypothetical protein FRX31_016206 [Thalictrum thalictroides]|uniref:Uncharacterized protein n=1 Tax=Thalictrum thalictroides TaxID=46969 RepID=A0A7J6WB70_THATH|nr:hypothetical protein FRX31_016206 [Thalictrum thalictroides]